MKKREKKKCPKCKRDLPTVQFYRNRAHSDGLSSNCRDCVRQYNKSYYQRNRNRLLTKMADYYFNNREEILRKMKCPSYRDLKNVLRRIRHLSYRETVLDHYSNGKMECACCQEKILDFLEIDHMHGHGNDHRRSLGITSSHRFYKWLIDNNFPKGYQVLCSNCNSGKAKNNGVCPHQREY